MKIFALFAIFALCIAFVSALPTPSEEMKPENLSPEQVESEQRALLEADGNPQGDSASRSKRFIWFGAWPYVYPSAYIIG